VRQQLKLPVHLRWELYPVKHEAGKKAAYGGSYMEEVNWWEKKRKSSLYNEWKFMIPEILFLRGLWQENRKLWRVSFPFHFGLYMLLATLGLVFIGAVFMLLGYKIAPASGSILTPIYYLTILLGFVGLTFGTFGAIGLLSRRLSDQELKNYSAPTDYLNLGLFIFFFGFALLAWLFHDHAFDGARAYVYGLLTFGGRPEGYSLQPSFLGRITIGLASFLIAYIPLTHMAHVFMKYFMYHAVRWEDAPNLRGSAIEAAVLKNLDFKPTWAAPHIGANGKKTWGEIATFKPGEGK